MTPGQLCPSQGRENTILASMAICQGSRVRIVGLTTSGLHLNDTSATVICWDSKLGRWRLRIADGKTAAVQPRNVEAVADDAFATLGATEGATEATIIELDAVPDVIDLTASAASSLRSFSPSTTSKSTEAVPATRST